MTKTSVRALVESVMASAKPSVKESKKAVKEYVSTYTVDEDVFYYYLLGRIEHRMGREGDVFAGGLANWMAEMFEGASLIEGSKIDQFLYDVNVIDEGDTPDFAALAKWYEENGTEDIPEHVSDEYGHVEGEFTFHGKKYLVVI